VIFRHHPIPRLVFSFLLISAFLLLTAHSPASAQGIASLPVMTASEPAPISGPPKVKIGIWRDLDISTASIQAVQGNCRITFFQTPTASLSGSLLSDEIVARLPEGEHLSLEIHTRGILARTSTGQEFPPPGKRNPVSRDIQPGYGHLEVISESFVSVERPGATPLVFSGKLEITLREGSLAFSVTQDLDDYLVSAVSDFCPSVEPEAIKAHTVVARTFVCHALSHPRHATESFHLCDTSHCLPFRGLGRKRELVDSLYPETADEVMLHNGSLFRPHFQLTCGGKISAAADIFGTTNSVHLAKEDRPDRKGGENCFHSPAFDWVREFSKEEMTDFLSIAFAGGATNIFYDWEPVKTDPTGRISVVKIRGKRDRIMLGVDFLQHLQGHFGPLSFRSMRFTIKPRNRVVIFTGKGEGEGVGFCRFGADGLAKKGWDYRKILSFYYSNITFGKNPTILPVSPSTTTVQPFVTPQ
jgi:SpoIID/LytB domain protein